MTRLPVWLPGTAEDEFLVVLRAEVDSVVDLHTDERLPAGFDARILVRGVPSAAQLDASRALERVIIPYAGVPERTRSLVAERPALALHNLHHNAAPTAELAIALMLAALKRVVPHDRDLRKGDWSRRYGEPETAMLDGRHALVLGYGAIGSRVAYACRALGMSVAAVRRGGARNREVPGVSLHGPAELPDLLSHADVLVLCVPLTDETRGLIGPDELERLPARACLVNVGRGELTDERALYEALRDRRLDSAGLDVWYRYPKEKAARSHTAPSAYPFHELDNVVMSPHRAGLTRQNEFLRALHLAGLLEAAAAGEEVGNRVDVERGY